MALATAARVVIDGREGTQEVSHHVQETLVEVSGVGKDDGDGQSVEPCRDEKDSASDKGVVNVGRCHPNEEGKLGSLTQDGVDFVTEKGCLAAIFHPCGTGSL